MPRSQGIPVLAPSEELLWQREIKGTRYAVTNLRLIVTKGPWLRDMLLGAVYSVELTQSLAIVDMGLFVAIGLLLLIALPLKYMGINIDLNSIFMAFGIFGLAIIIYGWFNRYRMTIYHPGGKIGLRGGGSVYDLMIQLREALLRAQAIHRFSTT